MILKRLRFLFVLSGVMACTLISPEGPPSAAEEAEGTHVSVPKDTPQTVDPLSSLEAFTETMSSSSTPATASPDLIPDETVSPSPTLGAVSPSATTDELWTDCSQCSFGTMLLCSGENKCLGDWIRPIDVLVNANDLYGLKGVAATGAPSDFVRDNAFGKLPGWTRIFLRGTYASLENLHQAATIFGMEEMYECFGYGPESPHNAGEEALDPQTWVPKAKALAEAASKCLVYGPAVQDYERMSTPPGEDKYRDQLLSDLISEVAPNVDIWVIQLAKYQTAADAGRDYDGNPYTNGDFERWISDWVKWIKTSNPSTDVWVQLGIGKNIPGQGCQPPQPPEYILEYREILIRAGVDGVFVMPSMPCQLSDNAQDHEYYLQSLAVFQDAIQLACQNPTTSSIFDDVPTDHPYHDEINALYHAGYTTGCSNDPLMYCPERSLNRAESAVFLVRGISGVDVTPVEPERTTFADISAGDWYAKWAEALWDDGFTAGCGTDPLRYCPLDEHSRAEGAVFYLRLLNGTEFVPPPPTGIFADVDLEAWYAPWVEAAYLEGLIEPCQTDPTLNYCPEEPLTRAVAANMMVEAKALEIN